MPIGYKVTFNQKLISSSRDSGEYARWEEIYDNDLCEKIVVDMKYPDVISEVDLRIADFGFLAWLEWSDGDSFGKAENRRTECLALFAEIKTANDFKTKLEKIINDPSIECYDENRNIVIDTDEEEIQIGNPEWLWDYFASGKRVHIDLVYLGE